MREHDAFTAAEDDLRRTSTSADCAASHGDATLILRDGDEDEDSSKYYVFDAQLQSTSVGTSIVKANEEAVASHAANRADRFLHGVRAVDPLTPAVLVDARDSSVDSTDMFSPHRMHGSSGERS